MKFVATSAFLNVSSLNIEPIAGSPHEREIPKGARFNIGKSDTFSNLRGEEKEAIASLFVAGRIISASNTIGVDLVDKEVVIEKKRLEEQEKKAKGIDYQAFVAQFAGLFAAMQKKAA